MSTCTLLSLGGTTAAAWTAPSPTGQAILSIHIVIGLLLGLGALAVLVQAVIARHLGAIASSALGLFALACASVTGASFTSSGNTAESMGMSVLTGVGLLCYTANLYLLRPPRPAPVSRHRSGQGTRLTRQA